MDQGSPEPPPRRPDPVGLAFRARVAWSAWEAARVSRWDPDEVRRLQARRLGELLRHVTSHSEYFRRKYAGFELDPSGFAKLPVMTRDEWRDRFDEAILDQAVKKDEVGRYTDDLGNLGRFYLGKYVVFHTSGTKGAPLPLIYDQDALVALFSSQMARGSALGRAGPLEGLRRLMSPFRLAIATLARGFYPSGAASEYIEAIAGSFIQVLRLSASQPDLPQRLREFRPHGLVSYPTQLARLATMAPSLGLGDCLRQVTSSGEPLPPTIRRQVEAAFGVPVVDHYGAGECLFLAEGCLAGPGFHVNADWVVLEVVDERGEPVPPGQAGAKALVTNLANRVQPFIRYELPDRIVMADTPCGCGNRLPRIERIEGRICDVFQLAAQGEDYMLTVHPVGVVLEKFEEINDWQVVQTGPDAFEIHWVRVPGHPERDFGPTVRTELLRFGVPPWVRVTVRSLDALVHNPRTGKSSRMIPLPGQG